MNGLGGYQRDSRNGLSSEPWAPWEKSFAFEQRQVESPWVKWCAIRSPGTARREPSLHHRLRGPARTA